MPQIMLLFLFLSVLEDSGYMSRAAFLMDGMLRKIGLNGKAFIPMLMGFGCTVPAVMASRVLEHEQDRKMTILLIPFMSCGAKLPVYALFAGIFFPEHSGIAIFSMYVLGILVAVGCGFLLRHTVFKDNESTFILELPPYRIPSFQVTMIHMWQKAKGFLIKAGTIIFDDGAVVGADEFQLHLAAGNGSYFQYSGHCRPPDRAAADSAWLWSLAVGNRADFRTDREGERRVINGGHV